MAEVIPSFSTFEEQCTLTFQEELVFIWKGHNLHSEMLLAVKRQEISLLNYVVFLMPSNTANTVADRTRMAGKVYIQVVFASWSVDLLIYTQIEAAVLRQHSWLGRAWR